MEYCNNDSCYNGLKVHEYKVHECIATAGHMTRMGTMPFAVCSTHQWSIQTSQPLQQNLYSVCVMHPVLLIAVHILVTTFFNQAIAILVSQSRAVVIIKLPKQQILYRYMQWHACAQMLQVSGHMAEEQLHIVGNIVWPCRPEPNSNGSVLND